MSTEAPVAPPVEPTPTAPPAPAPVGARWESEFIGQDFSFNHKALDRLPEHLNPLKDTLARSKNFDGLMASYSNLQQMASKKALAPLPANSPAEVVAERKQVMDTINGVPKEAKDYGIAKPADLPDQFWNGKLAESYAAWAHKHSVSPGAAKELVEQQIGAIKEQLAAQAQYEKDFFAKQESAFAERIRQDNIPADRASGLVEHGARALGLDLNNPDVQTLLKNADVRTMAMRHAIQVGEDKFVDGKAPDAAANDPAKRANAVMHDPSDPLYAAYWNRDGKTTRSVHDAAVTQVNEWLRADAEKRQPRRGR